MDKVYLNHFTLNLEIIKNTETGNMAVIGIA